MIKARLHDDYINSLDVEQHAVVVHRTERVQDALGVVLSVNAHALAVLKVDDGHHAVIDHDGVAGAEAVWRNVTEVHALLNEQLTADRVNVVNVDPHVVKHVLRDDDTTLR